MSNKRKHKITCDYICICNHDYECDCVCDCKCDCDLYSIFKLSEKNCLRIWGDKIKKQTDEWVANWEAKNDNCYELLDSLSCPSELKELFKSTSASFKYQQQQEDKYERLMNYLLCIRYYVQRFIIGGTEDTQDELDLKSDEEYIQQLKMLVSPSKCLYDSDWEKEEDEFPLSLATHIVFLKGEWHNRNHNRYRNCILSDSSYDDGKEYYEWAAERGHGPAVIVLLRMKAIASSDSWFKSDYSYPPHLVTKTYIMPYLKAAANKGYVPCIKILENIERSRVGYVTIYDWYTRAAKLNNPVAIEWCFGKYRKNEQKWISDPRSQKLTLELIIYLLETRGISSSLSLNEWSDEEYVLYFESEKFDVVVQKDLISKAWSIVAQKFKQLDSDEEKEEYVKHLKETPQFYSSMPDNHPGKPYYDQIEAFLYRPGGSEHLKAKRHFHEIV